MNKEAGITKAQHDDEHLRPTTAIPSSYQPTTTLVAPVYFHFGEQNNLSNNNDNNWYMQTATVMTDKPTHTDVLLGRGVATNRHPGNENFRAIVSRHVEVYVTGTKKQKMLISRSLVAKVRTELNPPGRFLKKDPETGLWHEVDDKRALEKTAQALRDGAAPLRKELSEEMIDNPTFVDALFEGEKAGNTKTFPKPKNYRRTKTSSPIKADDTSEDRSQRRKKQRSNPDIARSIDGHSPLEKDLMQGMGSNSFEPSSFQLLQNSNSKSVFHQASVPQQQLQVSMAPQPFFPHAVSSQGSSTTSMSHNSLLSIINNALGSARNHPVVTNAHMKSNTMAGGNVGTSIGNNGQQSMADMFNSPFLAGASLQMPDVNMSGTFSVSAAQPNPTMSQQAAESYCNVPTLQSPDVSMSGIAASSLSASLSAQGTHLNNTMLQQQQQYRTSAYSTSQYGLNSFNLGDCSNNNIDRTMSIGSTPTDTSLKSSLEPIPCATRQQPQSQAGQNRTQQEMLPQHENDRMKFLQMAVLRGSSFHQAPRQGNDQQEEFAQEMGRDEHFFGLCNSDPIGDKDFDDDEN